LFKRYVRKEFIREWYPRIVEILQLNPKEDKKAALLLEKTAENLLLDLNAIEEKLSSKPSLIVGAGPSLPLDLRQAISSGLTKKVNIIAADGAANALLEAGLTPDAIVTDLDGLAPEDLAKIPEKTLIVIHAHGDNQDKLSSLKLKRKIVGTAQVDPPPKLHNFGGFTDGDRAVFIVEAICSPIIFLAGMDLGEIIGKYSKPWLKNDVPADRRKKLKLFIAKKLLEWLALKTPIPIYNLTTLGREINGVPRISFEEAVKLVKNC